MNTETLPKKLMDRLNIYRDTLIEAKTYLSDNDERIKIAQEVLDRFENFNITIAIFGEVDAGKSALLNSLFGRDNDKPEECIFPVSQAIDTPPNLECQKWSEHGGLTLTFCDTPGIAGNKAEFLDIAKNIANKSDIIVYVVYETIRTELQNTIMSDLIYSHKPIIVVINKIDNRRAGEIKVIKDDIISRFKINEKQIVECAGHPRNGNPIIEPLSNEIERIVNDGYYTLIEKTVGFKIKECLEEVGKRKREEIKKLQIHQQEEKKLLDIETKERLIRNHYIIHGSAVIASGSAFALSQVPGGDEAALTAITSLMIGSLCANYGKLTSAMIGVYLGIVSGSLVGKMVAAYLYKWIPWAGNAINAGVTFSLHETQGWVIVSYLENGIDKEVSDDKLEQLKKEADKLKQSAKALIDSNEFSAEEIEKIKTDADNLKKQAKVVSDAIKK